MDDPKAEDMRVHRRNGCLLWAGWYIGALLISIVGTKLAYSDWLSSEAWQCWSSPTAWKRDAALAFVASVLVAFMLWSMRAFRTNPGDHSRQFLFPFRNYEWVMVAITIIILLFLNCFWLPHSFSRELVEGTAWGRPISVQTSFQKLRITIFIKFFGHTFPIRYISLVCGSESCFHCLS
jgi:hypothetical protein